MKIGIITDSIRDQSTGIGNYTKDVVLQLRHQLRSLNIFYLDFIKSDFNNSKLIKINNPFKFLKTYLWHNYLPLVTRKLDVEYITNFSGIPHIFPFRQKEIFFVYDISWYLFPNYHPFSRVLFYKLFFKKTLNDCRLVVVDSISTKNDLIKIFSINPNKILVIYPSFSANFITKTKIKEKINFPYILYIGTLEPRKNIESIIKAYKRLKDKGMEEKLILCGKKGWKYETIFSLIEKLQLNNDVIYKGYITNEEKEYLFKNAKFFLYPSFYEGFGIPVQEAMTYGCPVITSNLSSLPEVAGKAGFIIDPHNLDELTNAMVKVATNKKLRNKMREEGFRQVKRLSNDAQIKKLLEVL